ncbi:MAG: 3-hydroxyacyl-CoA dehydrogenase NAD-binding domain-containing protein [Rubrivivax sp.]
MNPVVTSSLASRILTIEIDSPPVNALSLEVRRSLLAALVAANTDAKSDAVVVCAAGRTFVAGGDIVEFDQPQLADPYFNEVNAVLDKMDKPVVAALHGHVLGGGLELAMACHGRVALRGAQLGLPEVKLGVLPGAGGTQRLPRLVGVPVALEMILSGAPVGAARALELGLVDEVVDDGLREAAATLARKLLAGGRPWPCASARAVPGFAPDLLDEVRRKLPPGDMGGRPAREIVRCVEIATGGTPFLDAVTQEKTAFDALRLSAESKAMRHVFFAEREAARIPNLPAGLKPRTVATVGVLGAGTMGTGIAMTFANAGYPVTLVDATQTALDRGLGLIRGQYEVSVAKGRLDAVEAAERLARIGTGTGEAALAGCDLVVEAVFENLDLKREVSARLGRLCRPGAIIATNTSTLDVDALAQASGRPEDFVGMHYFSPAHVMRLLEVVRGARTAPEVLATVMQIARATGKVAVVSGVCYGFIGNRMAEVYMREAEYLILEGATPRQVDAAVESLGFAMGPCRMLDMAGIDVGAKTVIEATKAGILGRDPSYRALVRTMFERGRQGQKTGAGYYRYEGRKAVDDPEVERIAADLARAHGIARRDAIAGDEVIERLLYPLFNEGAAILREGIAYRGSDIDVVWTAGYGFPAWRGGPMHMADRVGLVRIVERLNHYARTRGNDWGYWTVSPLLAQLAESGASLAGWQLPR